ncbi:PKD domain-containing protein [Chitinophaga sedimenti]|uniref:Ig-like domain-containing protein n=1 Tax=Chitinophaga sedimenti TaxID=2033606 RepID=UPI0020063733|nr:PKD domain-containing protein [Chitinophaga sedimenti]MCK7555585.1 PKD domain-containing protein [Chitinophaga sedimenti]
MTISGADFTNASSVTINGLTALYSVSNPNEIIVTIPNNATSGPIVVTTPLGTATSTGNLTVNPSPRPDLDDASGQGFSSCTGTATYVLQVRNTSVVTGTGNQYTIDWGDGSAAFTANDWASGATLSHNYSTQGYFNIAVTITPANGCTVTRNIQFYNGSNPLASFTTTSSTTGLCAPAPVQFRIGNWFTNSPGTRYEIDFGDGTPRVSLPHPLNATNTDYLLSHTYAISSCPTADFTATLRAINGCFTTTYTLNQIIIRRKPQANFTFTPAPACITTPVCFSNTTIAGYTGNNCNTTTNYAWDLGDGTTYTGQTPPCHTYATAGTYNVTLVAGNTGCGDDQITRQVVVQPQTPPPTTAPVDYCRGALAVPLTANGTNLRWYTTQTGGTGSTTAPTPGTATAGTVTYYVTQTLPNQCESVRVPLVVTVNPPPGAPGVTTPVMLCLNQTATPLTATGAVLTWYSGPTVGGGSNTAPTPSTAAVGSTIYYVSQTVNGCEGPRAAITVTVSPLPVAPVVTTPLQYCQFAAAPPLTAPGSGLLWYTGSSGGAGSPTAPTPATAMPGTTTYYVSQATGCGESPRAAIDVIVTAAPSANVSYTPNLLCNMPSTPTDPNPPVPVTFTGTTGGTFSIAPSGLSMDATGTLDPVGATAGTYTITYRIPAAGGCPVYTATANVTVSSRPTATISYPGLCTAGGPAAVTRTGSAGGVYTSTTGLVIDAATGTITPAGSTPGTYTVTYTIAAAAPCPGFVTTAQVTVTAAPAATIVYTPASLCNVATSNPPVPVTRTGTPGGSYAISPATGLSIDAVTGELNPAGATAGTYTISYTAPGTGACANYVATTTVTVNSTPAATISYPGLCSNSPVTAVSLSGTTGGTFSSTPGLSINATTGAITAATSTPGTYTVTYDIPVSAPCPGFTTTASVTITAAPTATISYTPAILCNVATANPPVAVVQTGTAGGTYTATPAGLPINPTTGEITPAGATPGVYTIRYTAPGTGACADYIATTTVTVTAAPAATINYPALCSNSPVTQVTLTGTTGGTFSAAPGLSINATTGAITATTSAPGTYTVTYDIPVSAPCPGFTTTAPVTITAAPTAAISYTPAILCNVANTPATPNLPVAVAQTGTPGGTYTVTPAGLPINPTTGEITPAGAVPGVYTISYTAPGTGACANYIATTTVTITSAPVATIAYPGSPYCQSLTALQPVTRTGNSGGVYTAPAGLSINAATGAINAAASTPGTYTVTYAIAPNAPCPGFTATATLQIVESPVISFPLPNQAICSGGSAVYVPTSTVAGTTYSWTLVSALPPGVNGSLSGNTGGALPSITLSFTNTGTTNQTITVRVTPVNPSPVACGGAPVDITLLVRPVVPAPVTTTANFCMDVPPQTLSVTPIPGTTIRWYSQAMVLLPGAPTVNTAVSGTYAYYISHYTADGCESARTPIQAIVHPTMRIVGSTFAHPSACGVPSGNITLEVVDLGNNVVPNFPVTVHYNRFAVPVVFTGTTNASGRIIIPLTAGTYSNFRVETSGGCISQVLPDVFTLRDPTPPAAPVAGYNPPVCSGTPLRLTALSAASQTAGDVTYVWAGPAFGPVADTVRNSVVTIPQAAVSHAGTYVVYAIQNNCISLPASFRVEVNQAPSRPQIVTRSPLCVGDALSLQAFSAIPGNAGLTYEWRGPAAGFPVQSANAVINRVTLQDAGIYTITVTSPQTGCSVSTDTTIRIGDYPVVKFAQDTLILPTGTLLPLEPQIMNSSAPGVLPIASYKWTPAQDLTCNDAVCSAPVAHIKNDICYNVLVTNVFGCSASDDICVRVFCKNSQVFIPNAFAPNGNVPENRILMVRASGISAIKSFRVFNRWGQLMYERNNFAPNSPQFGWDGMVKGRKADVGVYVYTVEVVCENGVPYSYKGNVTLF